MRTTFWSVKGGSGTTVVAAAHALAAAARRQTVLVDLAVDQPAVLGIDAPGPGLAEWLSAGTDVPADAVGRLLVPVGDGLHLLPTGTGGLPNDTSRIGVLLALLDGLAAEVVIDAGTNPGPIGQDMANRSDRSSLVVRPCYLALHRAAAAPLRPTDVVVVREPGRSLSTADIAAAIRVSVSVEIPFDRAISRTIDSGLLHTRVPRSLARSMHRPADRSVTRMPPVAPSRASRVWSMPPWRNGAVRHRSPTSKLRSTRPPHS